MHKGFIVWPRESFSCGIKARNLKRVKLAREAHLALSYNQSEHRIQFILSTCRTSHIIILISVLLTYFDCVSFYVPWQAFSQNKSFTHFYIKLVSHSTFSYAFPCSVSNSLQGWLSSVCKRTIVQEYKFSMDMKIWLSMHLRNHGPDDWQNRL